MILMLYLNSCPYSNKQNYMYLLLIGVSMSEPHIDHTPQARNNCGYVCMYVCICYVSLTSVCCTLVLEIRVHPEMLHILTCSMYWCAHVRGLQLHPTRRLNSKDKWSLDLLIVCRGDYQWRQVGECADTWYKRIQPTERLELFFSCLATCQRTCVKPRWLMGWLYCCFVTFISTKAQHWTLY